jgi:hypothetical protein
MLMKSFSRASTSSLRNGLPPVASAPRLPGKTGCRTQGYLCPYSLAECGQSWAVALLAVWWTGQRSAELAAVWAAAVGGPARWCWLRSIWR